MIHLYKHQRGDNQLDQNLLRRIGTILYHSFQAEIENLYLYRDDLFKPQTKPIDTTKNRYKLIRNRLEQILLNYNEIEGNLLK